MFCFFSPNFVGLENSAHVLEQGGKMYSATLGLVDIVRGTNSYYKLQLLEDDVQKRSVGEASSLCRLINDGMSWVFFF